MHDKSFEEKIAYCFGVPRPLKVIHYNNLVLEAYKQVPKGSKLKDYRKALMRPLVMAYEEIKRQTGWKFDIKKAVNYEFDLVTSDEQKLSFDDIVATLQSIYSLVMDKPKKEFLQPAYLRTFVYGYKHVLKQTNGKLTKKRQGMAHSIG